MNPWLLTALVTGMAGSLHCIGMCGPLAMALPVGRFPASQRALARGLYHLGRLSAYSTLGLLVGSVGHALQLTNIQRPGSVVAGGMLLMWLLISRVHPNWTLTAPLTRRLTAPLAQLLRQPTLLHMVGLGFLNGLLPCGSVYVALAGGVAIASPIGGALYLFLFGVGTLPAMLGVQTLANRLTPRLRQRFRWSLPLVSVLVALQLIIRGTCLPSNNKATGSNPIPVCHGQLATSK